jgi:hypothetical protein
MEDSMAKKDNSMTRMGRKYEITAPDKTTSTALAAITRAADKTRTNVVIAHHSSKVWGKIGIIEGDAAWEQLRKELGI